MSLIVTVFLVLSLAGYVWALSRIVRLSKEISDLRRQLHNVCRTRRMTEPSENGKTPVRVPVTLAR